MPFQFRKESIEENLNSTFPSQGQGNPPLYYNLSETVVPTYSINDVAEGSGLKTELQQAWDFSTNLNVVHNQTTTLTAVPGFYKVDLNCTSNDIARAGLVVIGQIYLNDGVSDVPIWEWNTSAQSGSGNFAVQNDKFYVFVRSGDSLIAKATATSDTLTVWIRQVATLNGTLVNPLGYSAA